MRLSHILEATEISLPTWNRKLAEVVAYPPTSWQQHHDMPQDERQKEYQRLHTIQLIMKKAAEYHAANFGGRRWPEFEAAIMSSALEFWRPLLVYLNNITEEWPEGHNAFINEISGRHGTNQETIAYLMKKGSEAPALTSFYHEQLSPKALRWHLRRRLTELNNDLQRELAKPKPDPKPQSIDPSAIDDTDEFRVRGSYYTVKQFQNRIKIVQQTQALSDEALMALVLDKRPSTAAVREALHLPWAPSNMRAYVDKHVFKK